MLIHSHNTTTTHISKVTYVGQRGARQIYIILNSRSEQDINSKVINGLPGTWGTTKLNYIKFKFNFMLKAKFAVLTFKTAGVQLNNPQRKVL